MLQINSPDILKYKQLAKGAVNYLNTFNDTINSNLGDERWIRIYSYMSKDEIAKEQFLEHLADTFVAYSKNLKKEISGGFYVKKNKGKRLSKFKSCRSSFLKGYSKDTSNTRVLEIPYHIEKKVFLE